jgi:hypothetical protein
VLISLLMALTALAIDMPLTEPGDAAERELMPLTEPGEAAAMAAADIS